jgi:diguanylate cyclase (GGDEF)-like protein
MGGGFVRNMFRSGVGKRILTLFLVAAIVPMLFTAWLAWHEFDRGLEQETERRLRDGAKQYGIEILTRLELATEKAAQILRARQPDGHTHVDLHEYLLDDFEAVWELGELAPPTISLGDEAAFDLAPSEREHLDANRPRLVITQQSKLVLLRRSESGSVFAFHLNADKIWGAGPNLPYNMAFCTFTEAGTGLSCTADINHAVHAHLAAMARQGGNRFGEWEIDGEEQFAAIWQLFLEGAFASPALDIIALQPRSFALQSGTDFRRVFVPAIALVLVLVVFLSLNFVARTLVPLRHLTVAARQIASGNLASRVRVRTADEFEWLGDAFNNMAARLERQITALEAMSGIDRLILSGTAVETVSEGVVRHLVSLTRCESAAVIARDFGEPDAGIMISMSDEEIFEDRVRLPADVHHHWCQPSQVNIAEVDVSAAPYKPRFAGFGQASVLLVPVVLEDDMKGALLLGLQSGTELSPGSLDRVLDLAGRFAVALSSIEREKTLYQQANFDPLTGLPNRQLLKSRLDKQISAARLGHHSGALLFLDLDRFKKINDVFGHSVGDAVLIQAANRISSEVRDGDMVARLGGDEFVVLLPNVRNEAIVRTTAERLLDRLGDAFTVRDIDHYVGASIGIVLFPGDGDSVETLLKNADAAMYRAKDAGRSRFEFFSQQLNDVSRRKINLERDLRRAFGEGKLEVRYQPQFDIPSGVIAGAEALLRWTHPVEGAISPAEFIPLAEDSGLIVDLGSWVIEKACEDLCDMLDRGIHPGPVSVNVSARQLRHSGFHNTVMDPIRRFGIHPGYMQLEVTETAVAQNRDTAIELLETLRNEGVRVAIDDFGTGYSSLSYLQQMPFDVIKIDKSFVEKIGSSGASDNICRTVIRMADELGKRSIAEGVETREQLEFLRSSGCDSVQGFFYSKALRRDEFIAFVEKQDFHTQRRKALEVL